MNTIVAFALLGLVAACPNACSGNGVCGTQDKCSCYQNWQGPDCSQRTCTFTLAWADTADGTNQAHYYAECGNKGVCDRKSGECKCFDGYEGKGCRRSTCPEGCSGHGTCEYIEELAGDYFDRRNGPGNKYQDLSCTSALDSDANTGDTSTTDSCSTADTTTTNVVSRSANTDSYHGHLYQLWDAGKIQGCKCDLGYYGPDCGTRHVPRGDDPLTSVKATTMKQAIQITGASSGQFYLKFFDIYGGTWNTETIDAMGGSNADDVIVASHVQDKLRALPNEVLEGVEVTAINSGINKATCHRYYDGVQHISAYDITTDGNYKNSKGTTNFCEESEASGFTGATDKMDLLVEFADKPGQTGVQYLLEVDAGAHGAGSFPVSAGISGATVTVAEVNYNDNLGNLSELSDCSDRGLDDGEGQCECFDGYRGLACEEVEALV